MIGLAVSIGVVAALVIGALVLPLWRRDAVAASRAEYDLRVYKDQLREVDRDLERGLLDAERAAAARIEIKRRMLSAATARDVFGETTPPHRWATIAAALAVPAAAIGLYAHLGSPGTPNVPFAERPRPDTQVAQHPKEEGEMITALSERLKRFPLDVDGWVLLGRSYLSMNRYADAVRALAPAVEYSDRRPDILSLYAEARVLAGEGTLNEETLAIFREIMERNPADPRAWFYTGLAKAQKGDLKGALQSWVDLEALSPSGAPWLTDLRGRINAVAAQLAIDPASVQPSAQARAVVSEKPSSPARGPTREDVDAAAAMSGEDRVAMIRTMVAGLAARLEENPDDLEGWVRLERSYRVLGETAKADEAQARITALRRPATPGPTREDVEAAKDMGADDRSDMIRAMVARLAARLEEEPDDLKGWLMLARSYNVLGETEKARQAQARADALQGKSPSP